MIRWTVGPAFALLAVAYYFLFGPGPTPSEYGDLPWWRPQGWILRWEVLSGLRDLSREEGSAVRFVPVLLFAIPPAALALLGMRLLKGAVARTVLCTLLLSSVAFVYYGYLAAGVWRFFGWRWAAVTLAMSALVSGLLLAPSLLASALRLPVWGRVLAIGGACAGVYLLSTEITGTNPSLRANLSPWALLTLFGLLLGGKLVGSFHAGAGLGQWVWARTPGMWAPLAGLAVAAIAAVVASLLVFEQAQTPLAVTAAVVAAGYALAVCLRGRGAERTSGAGPVRALAGALVLLTIVVSNWRAVSYQSMARDETSAIVIAALEDFRQAHDEYPETLDELVPDHLEAVPKPRVGWISHPDEEFLYSNFGDSYALEFSSVLWVQCAYSPPYAYAEEDWTDEGEYADESADGPADAPDVAAGEDEGGLAGSWSCDSAPPRLF
jgi:hypothetical protein